MVERHLAISYYHQPVCVNLSYIKEIQISKTFVELFLHDHHNQKLFLTQQTIHPRPN